MSPDVCYDEAPWRQYPNKLSRELLILCMPCEYSKEVKRFIWLWRIWMCTYAGFLFWHVCGEATTLRAYLEKYKQMSDVLLSNNVKRLVTAQKQHQQPCKSTINLLKSHPHLRGNLGRSRCQLTFLWRGNPGFHYLLWGYLMATTRPPNPDHQYINDASH